MKNKSFIRNVFISMTIVMIIIFSIFIAPNLYLNKLYSLLICIYSFNILGFSNLLFASFKDPGYIKDF
jgi:hypothetical protein